MGKVIAFSNQKGGSGKSTLIRHINRLIEPTDGQVLIDGEDALLLGTEELREKRRSDMSMVFQKFALLPHRTVIDNSALPLEVRGVERENESAQLPDGWTGLALADMKTTILINFPAECSNGSALPVR